MPKDFDANPERYRTDAEVPAPSAPQEQGAGTVELAPESSEPTESAPPRRSRRRAILAVLATAVIGAAAYWGHGYWTVGRYMVETDDAYVQADFAVLAPKIAGYVAQVPAVANAQVKAGEPLVVLEDGDYRDALALAEAQLAAQRASIERIQRQAEAADASVAQARARVDAAKATRIQTAADLARYRRLVSSDVATAQKLEAAQAADTSAAAAVQEAEAGVTTARANVAVIAAQKAEAQATLGGLEASRAKAQRDLDATVIRAPFDGTLGNLSVAVGDLVAPGARLLAVVPLSQVYVEANFKETQIAELAPGTVVSLHFDAFPGRAVEGRVEGIAPASGSQFSLLPPENATGNFTKVVQRVPVRIAVPAEVAAEGWMRPGLSVIAEADSRTTVAPATTVAAR